MGGEIASRGLNASGFARAVTAKASRKVIACMAVRNIDTTVCSVAYLTQGICHKDWGRKTKSGAR